MKNKLPAIHPTARNALGSKLAGVHPLPQVA